MKKKSGKCPEYLVFVGRLPCFCCYQGFWAWLLALPEGIQDSLTDMVEALNPSASRMQLTPTEAAHAGKSTSVRGLGQKYPDRESIPLCRYHHREAKDSHHSGTAVFWDKHPQLDRDRLISMLQRIFDESAEVAKK